MFIKRHRGQYPLGLMCDVLEVSRSGYHKWLNRKLSYRAIENQKILEIILSYYNKSKGTYGLPRIYAAIRKAGYKVNKKRISRLMKIHNIRAKTKKKFKVTTKQDTKALASSNLLKGKFNSTAVNQIWTSDITYIWTTEGWLYLAVVMDIYSRKIVGWSMDNCLSKELAIRALIMAIINRNPDKGVVFHSDRGSQYTSKSFRELLNLFEMEQSMSSTGNCYDNAITESFFHTLKTELIYWEKYRTREQAKTSIFEYIEIYYNRKRSHSSLGYLSPVEFEIMKGNELIKNVA